MSTSDNNTPLTQEEFDHKLDALCTEYQEAEALMYTSPIGSAEYITACDVIADLIEEQNSLNLKYYGCQM